MGEVRGLYWARAKERCDGGIGAPCSIVVEPLGSSALMGVPDAALRGGSAAREGAGFGA